MRTKISVLLLAALLLVGCGTGKKDAGIVTIGGEVVSREEFLLYFFEAQQYFVYNGGEDIWNTDFDGQSAQEVAKERALNSVKTVKLAVAHAADFGVTLTDQEKTDAQKQAQSLYDSLTQAERDYIGLDMDGYQRIMEENVIYQAVFSAIADSYALDQSDFDAYYEANRDELRMAATYVTLSTILTEDEETANTVRQALLNGADMAELSQTYELEADSKGDVGHVEAYVGQLLADYGWDLTSAESGQVMEPFVEAEGVYVVRVDTLEAPDETEVQNYAESQYATQKQTQLFQQAYQDWDAATQTQINQTEWDALEIFQE